MVEGFERAESFEHFENDVATTAVADFLERDRIMDVGVRSPGAPVPRLAGPAFTVRCPAGDNLVDAVLGAAGFGG